VTYAVASDAWQTQAGTSGRSVIVEAEAYATDDVAPLRLRELAFVGDKGRFKLQLRSSQALQVEGYIVQYREIIESGEIKKIECRLESTGAALLM